MPGSGGEKPRLFRRRAQGGPSRQLPAWKCCGSPGRRVIVSGGEEMGSSELFCQIFLSWVSLLGLLLGPMGRRDASCISRLCPSDQTRHPRGSGVPRGGRAQRRQGSRKH